MAEHPFTNMYVVLIHGSAHRLLQAPTTTRPLQCQVGKGGNLKIGFISYLVAKISKCPNVGARDGQTNLYVARRGVKVNADAEDFFRLVDCWFSFTL